MKLIDLKNSNEYIKIEEAANSIKQGGLVLFPTETVYGIGANGLDENAVKRIFEAKGRAGDNPLILHISNTDMLEKIATNISELEYKLMKAFFPGPFTIILKKKDVVPDIVTCGMDTIGIRMPDLELTRKLIDLAGAPLATPSANISGKPSATNLETIMKDLT